MWNPRMGGEKPELRGYDGKVVGSPPHGRGKAVKFRCTCGLQRITPAWAGKSFCVIIEVSNHKDHPRTGGEKLAAAGVVGRGRGSPPRRRGKGLRFVERSTEHRITPA